MYTKGEWKRGSLNDEPFARSCLSIYQEDGRRVAEISREGFMRLEEAEANANIVAAAPDMYEALREYQYYNRCHNDDEAKLFDLAMKALAKANGERRE